MRAGSGARFGVIMAGIVGILGCSSPLKRTLDAREAGVADAPTLGDATDTMAAPADIADRRAADGAADTAGDAAVVPRDLAFDPAGLDREGARPDSALPGEAPPWDGASLPLDSSAGDDAPDGAASRPEAAACTESFVRSAWSPSSLVTGGGPRMVTAADLNGDGNLDIVTPNERGGTVSVLLGKGDGSFAGNVDYSAGVEPFAVAVADVNGDGTLDLVTASLAASTVSVLVGTGGGTFAKPVSYATGGAAFSVAIGDVTGDGKLDAVTANLEPDTVSVLPGKGDGSFGAHVDYVVGADPTVVALGDLDGDGVLDVAVANQYSVSVLFARANGQLGDRQELAYTNSSPLWLGLADLNGDGRLDLVTTDVSHVNVFLASNAGSFAPRVDYPSGGVSIAAATGDVDGDGKVDVVVANGDAATLGILRGAGDGTLGAVQVVRTGPQVLPGSVALGDFNGDGRRDLVTTTSRDAVALLLARGDGTFGGWSDHGTGGGPAASALADLDGDGKLDLVTANRDDDTVSVLLGMGAGRLAAKQDYPTGLAPTAIALGDVDRDGKIDVVTANRDSDTVSVLLVSGAGQLAAKRDVPTDGHPIALALGDLDADGNLDLVVATTGSFPGTVRVLPGSGDGTFAAGNEVYAVLGRDPWSLAVADLDGDGKLDLVVGVDGHDGGGAVQVLLGVGDGTFTAGVDDQVTYDRPLLALGDLDGDGQLDLIVAAPESGTVWARHGRGDGTFTAAQQLETNTHLVGLALADLDHDGKLDLATANSSSVLIHHGKGDGTFATARSNPVEADLSSLALGDLNGDGLPDLVTTSTRADTWAALLSSCR